jgi:hypothetical protein
MRHSTMDTPESMKADLARWNNGAGIDLSSWASCSGNYSLAVGYLTVFWPEFQEYDGYILRKGFSIKSLRGFEAQPGATRKSVELIMNHLHIGTIHRGDDDQISEDKIIALSNALKEIYQAKLAWQFPRTPCVVELHVPPEDGDLIDFQLSFWQLKHDSNAA